MDNNSGHTRKEKREPEEGRDFFIRLGNKAEKGRGSAIEVLLGYQIDSLGPAFSLRYGEFGWEFKQVIDPDKIRELGLKIVVKEAVAKAREAYPDG